jgi:GAF domain-containing protein
MAETDRENDAIRENLSPQEEMRTWQKQLIRGMLRAMIVAGLLAAAAGTYDSLESGDLWTLPIYWGSYGIVVLLAFWRRAPYTLQVSALIGMLYFIGFADFIQDGSTGSARAFMLAVPFLAGLFLERRESILALLLSTLTMGGFGWAFLTGRIVIPGDTYSTDAGGWIAGTFVLFMLGTLMVVSLNYLVPRFAATLSQSRKLTLELEERQANLEVEVAERTAELERRSAQLETAAQIARDAAAIRGTEQLLNETVRLVSDRFGFYHAGIFLLDEAKEYAVLRAASSEGGQRMLAQGHRLKVGEIGIVGYVTGRGEPRIALDVGVDATYFDNPNLPETRSEIALPLRARDEIIGALDVQSRKPEAFSQKDVSILLILADQIAIAIANADLYQQAQESLQAEQRAYSELSRQAWLQILHDQADLGQRYDPYKILPADGRWRKEMRLAVQRSETVLGQDESLATLAIPLKIHDQVIGVLDARKPAGAGGWTSDEIELLETLTGQLEAALESARLYQQTQLRAVREKLTGQVGASLRQSLDVETVLKTAAQEVRQILELPEVIVRLVPSQGGSENHTMQKAIKP